MSRRRYPQIMHDVTIEDLYALLDTDPFIGELNNKYSIDDYDYMDRESMEYEIRIIIKGRYRK